jgi:cell division protein FtsW (lipid II flippase)
MKTYNKIMEAFWLAMGVVLTVVVIYMMVTGGTDKNLVYFVFPGICFMMFFARRFMRRRMEKHQKWMEENAGKENNS